MKNQLRHLFKRIGAFLMSKCTGGDYMSLEVITQQQNDMITMLIQGENITDIAKRLGVNRNTIYNWKAKDHIRAELDKRKQDMINQGNQIILKDLDTYIGNIKELANDKSDKRVCLAANQYLINRIYGSPTSNINIDNEIDTEGNGEDIDVLSASISKFKIRKK
ncbi:helix-turn-helix domain-containing protein [Clostridium botulinum]|uniref:helix-turn-helix domain-containing protein n=2 Tax=Clostridium TaxID=1485 RepID=UPI0004D825F5|nr:helix-turn-helix domain-containing protein [Clostridium botulinum]KEI08052.1 resolvase family protein [Clostridium novyi B str. NCTC 9691]